MKRSLKWRPSENSLADFCTSALLKALKINHLIKKKADDQAFRISVLYLIDMQLLLCLSSLEEIAVK